MTREGEGGIIGRLGKDDLEERDRERG